MPGNTNTPRIDPIRLTLVANPMPVARTPVGYNSVG